MRTDTKWEGQKVGGGQTFCPLTVKNIFCCLFFPLSSTFFFILLLLLLFPPKRVKCLEQQRLIPLLLGAGDALALGGRFSVTPTRRHAKEFVAFQWRLAELFHSSVVASIRLPTISQPFFSSSSLLPQCKSLESAGGLSALELRLQFQVPLGPKGRLFGVT